LILQFAHFLGYLNAIRDLIEDHNEIDHIENEILKELENLNFAWVMEALSPELERLWTTYPNWDDIYIALGPIMSICEEVFEQFNVILHDQGESVYVELPLTPETCPTWPPPGW